MSEHRLMVIFGTRPEAIKMAPVIHLLRETEGIKTLVAVTAQHREMLDQVLELFQIEPDYDLDIMEAAQSLSDITVRVLKGLEEIIAREKPDMLLVHGDTSSTFVAALAGFYSQVRVGHVEAGLRSYNKYSPFPEEINRHLTGVLADLHFAPTDRAKRNLLSENISQDRIIVTGNTVIDALLSVIDDNYCFELPELKKIDYQHRKVVLMTAHRRENLGEGMENIFRAVERLVREEEELEVVFPVHLNPLVREKAYTILGELERVHLLEPLDYLPFANLLARSYLVLTDSGGLQEEAPSLGKPVLVMRDNTERPEAVEAGTVKLVGTDREQIISTVRKLLHDKRLYNSMAGAINPFGDGQAAKRIVDSLLDEFGLKEDI